LCQGRLLMCWGYASLPSGCCAYSQPISPITTPHTNTSPLFHLPTPHITIPPAHTCPLHPSHITLPISPLTHPTSGHSPTTHQPLPILKRTTHHTPHSTSGCTSPISQALTLNPNTITSSHHLSPIPHHYLPISLPTHLKSPSYPSAVFPTPIITPLINPFTHPATSHHSLLTHQPTFPPTIPSPPSFTPTLLT